MRQNSLLKDILLITDFLAKILLITVFRGTPLRPSFMLFKGRYSKQSSAKRRTVDSIASVRSLIWHKNRRGPKTVPWGTPESTLTASDSSIIHNNVYYKVIRDFSDVKSLLYFFLIGGIDAKGKINIAARENSD